MPGNAARKASSLDHVYRRHAAETSPLYERVAIALSESGEALRAIEKALARRATPR